MKKREKNKILTEKQNLNVSIISDWCFLKRPFGVYEDNIHIKFILDILQLTDSLVLKLILPFLESITIIAWPVS